MDYKNKYEQALERARIWKDKSGMPKDKQGILDNIFPELRESPGERIRKALIDTIKFWGPVMESPYMLGISKEEVRAWLEKQENHANFRNKIEVGDKVTRNRDGVLVNLSQLNRVAKVEEKQGEQKLAEWHREDEQNLNACLGFIPDAYLYKWLTDIIHIKYDRPSEWSEEDENRINRLIAYFEDKESFTAEDDIVYVNWLKSLRPQNRWKPSDEQIEILDMVLTDETMDDNVASILRELREQLKRLKGE